MKVLFDSDALFAIYVSSDANHKKAISKLIEIEEQSARFYVTSLVLQETATVLSYKVNQKVAKDFLDSYQHIDPITIRLSIENEQNAWNIFKQQTKKGSSFIDCANIAIYQEFELDKIFTFDKFYQYQDQVVLV